MSLVLSSCAPASIDETDYVTVAGKNRKTAHWAACLLERCSILATALFLAALLFAALLLAAAFFTAALFLGSLFRRLLLAPAASPAAGAGLLGALLFAGGFLFRR